jgi:hypothetical protein
LTRERRHAFDAHAAFLHALVANAPVSPTDPHSTPASGIRRKGDISRARARLRRPVEQATNRQLIEQPEPFVDA